MKTEVYSLNAKQASRPVEVKTFLIKAIVRPSFTKFSFKNKKNERRKKTSSGLRDMGRVH